MTKRFLCRVGVAAPLHREFDYFSTTPVTPGQRVRVPFGRRKVVGVVTAVDTEAQLDASRIKAILACLDRTPVFDATDMQVLRFAAAYYQHPLGEVMLGALPKALREGADAKATVTRLRLTDDGAALDATTLARAPRQRELLIELQSAADGLDIAALRHRKPSMADAAKRLIDRGAAYSATQTPQTVDDFSASNIAAGPTLTPDQQRAVDALARQDSYDAFVLYGVTGSGKTEVYLRAIERHVRANRQALVLVPEIALTPQLVTRFEKRFAASVVSLHSGLNDGERLAAWRAARDGSAAVVIGTRSAVFTPLARPGIVIVDEEHDASFKQQEGFRYHGRDIAVYRARKLDVPIVLGSATPTLETLHNANTGRYRRLDLPERVGSARDPAVRLVDLRQEAIDHGVSGTMLATLRRHLEAGSQVMLFLNRRGFAPAWFCSGCGAIAACLNCDANMTYHHATNSLRCHHCAAARRAPEQCETCDAEHKPVGQGTERIEHYLEQTVPGARVARMDRDTTRRRGALDEVLSKTRKGQIDILVGTQMLTKGHHFPGVGMVGILNADQGLFSADFRASERLAQTIVQMCGRAGRGDRAGEVLIQTAFAEHPLLRQLIEQGYDAFARDATVEREAAGWPPFAHLALIRARSASEQGALDALGEVQKRLTHAAGITVLGPASAPMRRRARDYHAQLLLQSASRKRIAATLHPLLDELTAMGRQHRARISVDIDPVDLY